MRALRTTQGIVFYMNSVEKNPLSTRACLPLFCARLTHSLPYITLCRRAKGELTKLHLNRVTFWNKNVNKNQNVIEELTDQRKQITRGICSKSDGKVGNLRKAAEVARPEARGGIG